MEAQGGQEPAAQASVGQVCSLERERAQLEAMNRELTQMLLKMNTLCSKCFQNKKYSNIHLLSPPAQGLLLNVDIVSQFDPAVVQELAGLVEECEGCIARMNQRRDKSYQCLQEDSSPHTDNHTSNN